MKRYYSDYNRIMSLIYEDQPISPQADREIIFIPERIKSIRSMGRGVAAWRQPREVIFLHQAKVMADYEDDYEYTRDIPVYQPTYESLTDEQLRGYFGFRTRIRKGSFEKGPAAYAYLYLYELINLIGVGSPQEGLERLSAFADRYGRLDPSILPYAEQWLIDYVLYYGLDPELLRGRKPVAYDKRLAVLLNATSGERKDTENKGKVHEIFEAMLWISGLREGALFAFRLNPELFERASVKSFQEMCRYYDFHRKQSLMEDYVGVQINRPAKLFSGAVFHEMMREKPAGKIMDVQLSELTTYHFDNGIWSVKTYPRDYRNRRFADLLKTLDSVILEEAGNPEAALAGIQTKWVRKLIRKTIEEAELEIREEEARRVEIDFSSLDHIRSDAANTMEKLITEDELDLMDDFFDAKTIVDEMKDSKAVGALQEEDVLPAGLDNEEYALLQCLLNKGNPADINRNGKMMSVIVDSINEKLFDEIGDIVIEDGNPPRLVEDYAEELKGLVS